MPFCHRFSPNYGSLVTLCCLARSVYMYRHSANSMSPFSTHRHPCILAYLTMPCGFATCVLYAELSTYACLRREKNAIEMHSSYSGSRMGYFRPGLKIFYHDSLYLFYEFLWDRRSESTWWSVRSLGTLPACFEGPAEDHGVDDNQIGAAHEHIGISTLPGTKGALGWGLHPSVCSAV